MHGNPFCVDAARFHLHGPIVEHAVARVPDLGTWNPAEVISVLKRIDSKRSRSQWDVDHGVDFYHYASIYLD